MSRYAARPGVGQRIQGATGPEEVLGVFEQGRRLLTMDTAGRTWTRTRVEHGTWVLVEQAA